MRRLALPALILVPSLLVGGPPAAHAIAQADPPQPTSAAPEEPIPPAVASRIASRIERLRVQVSGDEREEIIESLIETGPVALPLIVAEMERRDRQTEPVMIYVLGAIGDPASVPILEALLAKRSGRAAHEVLYSLSLVGRDDALVRALRTSNVSTLFDQGGTVIDYIAGALGPDAIPILIEQIPMRAKSARIAALNALGTIADESAIDFLLEWTKREDPLERRHALVALSRIGGPRVLAPLVDALADPEPVVRIAAVEGLGYARLRAAVPSLVARLDALEPGAERRHLVWSLGLLGGTDAARALVALHADASADERDHILQALGNTKDRAALPVLEEAALRGSPQASRHAVEGLAAFEGSAARDALLKACNESRSHVASLLAAVRLVTRFDARASMCVTRVLRKDLERRRGLSHEAIALLNLLPHTAPPSAAEEIESLAADATAPALRYRLTTAARAIRLVNDLGSDVEPWIELLTEGSAEDVDLAVRRLGELGDPRAVDPLTRLLGRIEPERAHIIPIALGRIGSGRATPFLITLLTSDLYRVPELERARAEAALALARYARAPHVAAALEESFLAERGRLVEPLVGYLAIRGSEGIPRAIELKTLLLRRRDRGTLARHEKVNWSIRLLRAGLDVPLDEFSEP